MSNLKEMVVVVTGGAQGIGREYARRLVADGARVVVADLNAEKGAAVAAELGDRAIFRSGRRVGRGELPRHGRGRGRHFGRIDGLVNNAAIFATITMKPFWELSVSEWDALMAVNLRGVGSPRRPCSRRCGTRAAGASSTSRPA